MQSGHPESANATQQPIYHAGTSQQSFSFDGFPQQSTGVGGFNLASEDNEAAPRFPATAPEEDDYADTTMRAEDFLNNIHSWGDPPVLQIYNPTAQTNDLVSSSATNYGLPTSNQDMAQRNTAQPNHHFPGNTLTQHSNIAWSSTSSNSRGGPLSDYSLQGTHSSTAPSSSYASMSEAQRAEAEKMLRDRLSQSLYVSTTRYHECLSLMPLSLDNGKSGRRVGSASITPRLNCTAFSRRIGIVQTGVSSGVSCIRSHLSLFSCNGAVRITS